MTDADQRFAVPTGCTILDRADTAHVWKAEGERKVLTIHLVLKRKNASLPEAYDDAPQRQRS
ncbi:hypothetical protein [Falsirhodobacter deserti]|uniref:hypothetical protein n=1 Tax=Falsirhodobacter deserti TaxID=1365611 RepID=UPI0013E2AEA0|nr:hypothetical protein [Falsirhodobacter deserti]